MSRVLELENVNFLTKDVKLDNELELGIKRNENSFLNVVQGVVNKGAEYVIKAMPVNDHIKDILLDVKDAFKTKDFKNIVKTALNSSIREGLEVLQLPKNVLSDITKIKDIVFKGGFREGIGAGIDIVTKKYLKNNLLSTFVKDFLDKTKKYVYSKDFSEKIDIGIKKIFDKVDKYKNVCKEWFKSYDDFNIENMNKLCKYLNKNKSSVSIDKECIKENNTIQNMMELINVRNSKLTPMQMQICSNL